MFDVGSTAIPNLSQRLPQDEKANSEVDKDEAVVQEWAVLFRVEIRLQASRACNNFPTDQPPNSNPERDNSKQHQQWLRHLHNSRAVSRNTELM